MGKIQKYYEATRAQALKALAAYPKGLQIGGGVCPGNAAEYLEAGASHVIVTSYVFKDGQTFLGKSTEEEVAVGGESILYWFKLPQKKTISILL